MKAKRGKCLALVAVLAMVVCAFAIALPAGESDAADPVTTGAVKVLDGTTELVNNTLYYTDKDVSVSVDDGITATVYVLSEKTLTVTSNEETLNVIPAKSISADKKVTFVEGLSIKAAASSSSATYKVAADSITTTAEIGNGSTYGVAVPGESGSTVYYAPGERGAVDLTTLNSKVSVMNGSITVNGVYGTGSTKTVKATVQLTNIKSSTPVIVNVSEAFAENAGKFTISGGNVASSEEPAVAATSGDITVTKGSAIISSTNTHLDGVLNGFADASKVLYGTAVTAVPTGSTISTVYGEVANNQTITTGSAVAFTNAQATSVTIKNNGGKTVSLSVNGSATVSAPDATTGVRTLTLDGKNTVTLISGTFYSGSSSDVTIGNNQEITVSNGATLELKKNHIIGGKVNVSGKILGGTPTSSVTVNVTGTTDKKAEFRAYAGSEIGQYVTITEGTDAIVDISGAQGELKVSGDQTESKIYGQTQIVTVLDTFTVKGSTTIVGISGGLNIPAGTELVITGGAKVTVSGTGADVKIDGTLIVEEGSEFIVSASVAVSGTIESDGTLTFNTVKMTVKNGGSIVSNGTLTSGDMTLEAGAEMTVSGEATFTNVANAGKIVLSEVMLKAPSTTSRSSSTTATISLTAAGAVVTASEVKTTTSYTLTINDDGLKYNNKEVTSSGDNSVVISGSATVSGLEVVSSVKTVNKVDYKYLDISGNVSAEATATPAADAPVATITVSGSNMTVADSLTIGEKIDLTFEASANAKLTVSGELTAIKGTVTGADKATLDVTGLVQTSGKIREISGFTINAVYFKTVNADKSNTHNYSTLAAGVASGVDAIEILGTVKTTEDVTIPAGMTMKVTNKLTIGDTQNRNVTVTAASGAKISGTGEITVDGTLVLEVAKDCRLTNIVSDVKVTADPAARYTNIYTALNGASAGETVTVTKNAPVQLDADITVKDGVTLSVPAGKSLAIASEKKITVTIDGTVVAYSGIDGTFKTDASKLKIAGQFLTGETQTAAQLYAKYAFAGAYYAVTDSTGTYTHITTVGNAVADAQKTENIDVYGENTVGDIEVVGKDKDNMAQITLIGDAKLTAGNIKLTYAVFDCDGAFNGTVSSDLGAVKMTNVKAFEAQHAVAETYGDDAVFVVTGTPVKADTSAGAADAAIAVQDGAVAVNAFDITGLRSFSIASSAVLNVYGMNAKTLKVAGTLNVVNGRNLAVTDYVEVTGTLTVAEEDTVNAKAAGVLSVPKMYIGIAESTVGAAAAVTAPAVDDLETVYLAAGSTISEKVLENLDQSSEFLIEGSVKFTIYTTNGAPVLVKNVKAPSTDGAAFVNWQYTSSGKNVDVGADSTEKIGDHEQYSALLDYEVYTVVITADYGFSDVYIDGVRVAGAAGGISQTATASVLLTAGDHTVTWKLRNNYSGDITCTFDGKAAADGKFTIGSDMKFDGVSYSLVITGAQQQAPITPSASSESDGGMGITDILLVVLVVLIAVMAIMAALRMMRS